MYVCIFLHRLQIYPRWIHLYLMKNYHVIKNSNFTRAFQVDLNDAMDNFFNTLYQKMFTVLNSQYNFDNKYLECVGEHMKEMRPFGDVPQKLGVQIKRAFVATRAFSQALTVSANVLKNMQSVREYTLEASRQPESM